MTNVKKQDFTRRIAKANSTEMIVILYDMVLTYIQDAKEAARFEDYEEFHIEISRIQGCIQELIKSLNYKYEPAKTLRMFYSFCIKRLALADAKRDATALDEVVKVIEPLRDAYEELAPQNTSGPLMGNSQEVYAGLTYGRRQLTESLTNEMNRGYLV